MDGPCGIVRYIVAIVQEAMDPLSDILSLLKPTSYGFRGLDAGGDWALEFGAVDGIKCYAINSGECWIDLEGATEPVRLAAGDVVLLPSGNAARLYSSRAAPVTNGYDFFPTLPAGEMAVLNGGGGFSGVGGYFEFMGLHADVLLSMLPPIVHISAEASKAELRSSIERMMREMRNPQPGSSLIAEHLAQTLLIEALRLHLAGHSQNSTGWLFALADRQMHAVIAAMHEEPERKWTLQTLARVAGMSRSSFSARFKATVGEPAIDYLTRWRMMLAADRLTNKGMPISVVAPLVGYDSESAFGAAFKRVIGSSPRQFAKAIAP
jgi:AraC-like DNA-binding protein